MVIREEQPSDTDDIDKINVDAFEGDVEARLIKELRKSADPFVSLVAEIDGHVVGHIVFTPVELCGDSSGVKIIGLGPMAVLSSHQQQGIGSQMVKQGLETVKQLGYDAVIVLGHPTYYPKFGFVPASRYNIKSEYDVPDDVFMAMELTPGALQGKQGVIRYHQAFNMFE